MMAVQQYNEISIQSENITEYRSLQRGDQLAVEDDMSGIEYYHHGVFLGHDIGVADFGGVDKRDAKVRVVDILQFTNYGKRRLVCINYPDKHCLPPEIAAANAEKLVADPSPWGPYDLIKNNCEHFATKCKTGVAESFQVVAKIRSCLENPRQIFTYAAATANQSGSGSLGSGR